MPAMGSGFGRAAAAMSVSSVLLIAPMQLGTTTTSG
jgi:hypothetical protein